MGGETAQLAARGKPKRAGGAMRLNYEVHEGHGSGSIHSKALLVDRLRVLRALRSAKKFRQGTTTRKGRLPCCLPALAGFASLPSMAPDGAPRKARGTRADKMKTSESLRNALAKKNPSRLKRRLTTFWDCTPASSLSHSQQPTHPTALKIMAKLFSGLTLIVALVAIFFGFQSKELVGKLQVAAERSTPTSSPRATS